MPVIYTSRFPNTLTSPDLKPTSSFASRKTGYLFKTNLNEEILLSKENPLTIKIGENSEPSPYILIRKNLHALLSRSVFYELVDLAEEKIINDKKCLVIESMGESFKIHEVEKE